MSGQSFPTQYTTYDNYSKLVAQWENVYFLSGTKTWQFEIQWGSKFWMPKHLTYLNTGLLGFYIQIMDQVRYSDAITKLDRQLYLVNVFSFSFKWVLFSNFRTHTLFRWYLNIVIYNQSPDVVFLLF